MFDHQVVYTIRKTKAQPDLESLVRLFLNALPACSWKFIDVHKYFSLYYMEKDETVLGSNLRNLEIRLYFIHGKKLSANIFMIFTLNNLNITGLLQSLYLYPLLLITLRCTLRTMNIHIN